MFSSHSSQLLSPPPHLRQFSAVDVSEAQWAVPLQLCLMSFTIFFLSHFKCETQSAHSDSSFTHNDVAGDPLSLWSRTHASICNSICTFCWTLWNLGQRCYLFTWCWLLTLMLLLWSCPLFSGRDWPSLKLLFRITYTLRWSCEFSAKTWPRCGSNYYIYHYVLADVLVEGVCSMSVVTCINTLRDSFNISSLIIWHSWNTFLFVANLNIFPIHPVLLQRLCIIHNNHPPPFFFFALDSLF